jgi:hypothetical protein
VVPIFVILYNCMELNSNRFLFSKWTFFRFLLFAHILVLRFLVRYNSDNSNSNPVFIQISSSPFRLERRMDESNHTILHVLPWHQVHKGILHFLCTAYCSVLLFCACLTGLFKATYFFCFCLQVRKATVLGLLVELPLV